MSIATSRITGQQNAGIRCSLDGNCRIGGQAGIHHAMASFVARRCRFDRCLQAGEQ